MTRAVLRIAVPFLIFVGTSAQSNGQTTLSCTTRPNSHGMIDALIEPGSNQETVRLHQAPHGAKRTGKHQLYIVWSSGTQVLKDKPPYDEPLDGIRWTYCGYSTTLQLHLIGKQDVDVFTGVLMDDKTGLLLPGGQTVLFSPDHRYYLAYEQPDGQDGETIKLYSRSGEILWIGFNGILSPDGKMVVAEFQSLRWDSRNRLLAELSPLGKQKEFLTLTKESNGKWGWLPKATK
jgi:hypothetical protein